MREVDKFVLSTKESAAGRSGVYRCLLLCLQFRKNVRGQDLVKVVQHLIADCERLAALEDSTGVHPCNFRAIYDMEFRVAKRVECPLITSTTLASEHPSSRKEVLSPQKPTTIVCVPVYGNSQAAKDMGLDRRDAIRANHAVVRMFVNRYPARKVAARGYRVYSAIAFIEDIGVAKGAWKVEAHI